MSKRSTEHRFYVQVLCLCVCVCDCVVRVCFVYMMILCVQPVSHMACGY